MMKTLKALALVLGIAASLLALARELDLGKTPASSKAKVSYPTTQCGR